MAKKKQTVNKKIGRNYQEFLVESLKEPEAASLYVNAALEEEDAAVLLLALRNVVEASGFAKVSKDTGLNREGLYRMLSGKGNPRLTSLQVLLDSLGLKLSVEPKKAS